MEGFQETHASPPPQIIRCPQGGWARSPIEKANLFANYLSNIFKPHSSNTAPEITEYLHSPFQMSLPIKPFTSLEVTELIHRLNPRKAPGHDQISNKAIKELPVKGIALISSIFNAILRLEYYSKTWKTSLITLIPKPGKPIHEGIPLWGTAAISHTNKIETMEAKILRTIVNAPWYVRNDDIRRNLGIPTVKEAIISGKIKGKNSYVTGYLR